MNHKRAPEAVIRMDVLKELGVNITDEDRIMFMNADPKQLERLATNLMDRHYNALEENTRILRRVRKGTPHRERIVINM